MPKDIFSVERVHCVGLGGIGVSAVAKWLLARGATISGSDLVADFPNKDFFTERGVKIFLGHARENVLDGTELILAQSALKEDNPEILSAKEKNIPVVTYPEALAAILGQKRAIGISGTNGKTTTTALTGLMLERGNLDPLVFVGGRVSGWLGNFRSGNGEFAVAERCEYRRHFLLGGEMERVLITNIEADHLDYYKDLNDIKEAFLSFAQKASPTGKLLINADDPVSREIFLKKKNIASDRLITFGLENQADYQMLNIAEGNGEISFELFYLGESLGKTSLFLPGRFNLYNVLAATALAHSVSVKPEAILETIKNFRGTWRRFEQVGQTKNGALVISDYAHHPSALREVIRSAYRFYKNKKILFVFEPHQRERTISLREDFLKALAEARDLILCEIYSVAGREESGQKISSADLVKELDSKDKFLGYAKDLNEAEKIVQEKIKNYEIVVFIGAGPIDSLARKLAAD